MEIREDEAPDAFKVPQPMQSKDISSVENVDSDSCETSDLEKSNKSDRNKMDQKVPKNRKEKSEQKSRAEVPLPYKEPSWSSVPPSGYSFEIIKNGTFVETYDIKSSLVVFGRLDVCNIVFEHPSVSRYHAVIQYCEGDATHPKGFYLYDLGSTHGTFLNKEKVTPKIYYKLKVGYILKFGGSTRLHLFQGPEEEEVEEKPASAKIEDDVCNWGMGEDADAEEDLSENPFALSTPNEELYLEDPKKTLRGWFEREGYELEYNVEEKGFKTFSCRIQLPIDTPTGDFMPVEASVTGKKKEAVIACALEACRTLDRLGLLRQSHQESRQRKKKKWEENDYYDSDEDTFLDRTGTIEKKREMRKRTEKKSEVETYESIETKLKAVTEEINEITKKLSVNKTNTASERNSEVDSLEAYMSTLSDSTSDKIERRKLRFKLQEAEKEKTHLEKLLDIARPAKLPPVIKHPGMIGKKLKSKLKIPQSKPAETVPPIVKLNENEEEIEESDSEDTNVIDSSKATDNSPSLKHISERKQHENVENPKAYGLILNVTKNDNEVPMDSGKRTKSDSKRDKETKFESGLEMGSKEHAIGCKRPPGTDLSDVSTSKKKKKEKQPESNVDVYTAGNAEYSTWVPPAGQTGDGMTHLNAKYGY